MMKRIICILCTLMILFGMSVTVSSAAVPDPEHFCSLTLYYSRGGAGCPDLEIEIYRVAELKNNGLYYLVEPYNTYPIKIHGITSQKGWRDTAQTVRNYVISNQIDPYRCQSTDEEGKVIFSGLETGLYLVKGTTVEDENGGIIFHDFMVYLPTPVGNGYKYDVEARPKYTEFIRPEAYTVLKLWKDAEEPSQRPDSVCVDILRDGVVQESVILSAENNWSYHWETLNHGGEWSVIEKDVPEGYQVSIVNNDTTFVITNSKIPTIPEDPTDPDDPGTPDDPDIPDDPYDPDTPEYPDIPDDPSAPGGPDLPELPEDPTSDVPKTGDTTPLLRYAILFCISGFGLIVLGVLRLRERANAKKW